MVWFRLLNPERGRGNAVSSLRIKKAERKLFDPPRVPTKINDFYRNQ